MTGFDPGVARPWRQRLDSLFKALAMFVMLLALASLGALIYDVFSDGASRLSWEFLTSFSSRRAENAGILHALAGSVYIMLLTAVLAVPVGVGAAIYLEEYGGKGFFPALIEVNLANLAGVPSIIYGLLGLELFVRVLNPITGGRSVLAGALTMALLVMPIVVIAAREAIRAVPDSLRQGGYALGASRWQVVQRIVRRYREVYQ